MTLENLLAIHRLQRFEPDAAGIQRLLAAAERNLADAAIAELSAENRFDAAADDLREIPDGERFRGATGARSRNRPTNPPHADSPAARHSSVRRRAKPVPRASSSCLK